MSEIIDPISTVQRIVRSSLHNFGEGFDITQTKIDGDYDLVNLSNILTYNFSLEEYVE